MGMDWFINRLEALVDDKLIEFLQDILEDESAFIVELNKKQLERGERSDGKFLRPYSESTKRIRALEGNPVKGELIALYDSGDFWNGFWSKAYDGKLELLSSDVKTNKLIAEYGEQIFGLTESNFKVLGDRIVPQLRTKIINYLKA